MPTRTFTRKLNEEGVPADPAKGVPSFIEGIKGALYSRTWRVNAETEVIIDIDGAELTLQEDADLVSAYVSWGTEWVPLNVYKELKIEALGLEVTLYHNSRYDQPQRESFVMYYQVSIQDGKVNRAAKVREAMDWTTALQIYYVTCAGMVLMAANKSEVDAVVLDLVGWEVTNPDPHVTIPWILSIPD